MPDQARYRSRARFDNDLYSEVMPEPHPARATVGADPITGALVEIEVVAALRIRGGPPAPELLDQTGRGGEG